MIPKNILITGGLGYLGGRLAAHLKEKRPDAEIILTTRRSERPKWADGLKIVQMDLGRLNGEMVWLNEIDVIIHLASMHQQDCAKNPKKAFEINTIGLYDLLGIASERGVQHVIYFSTFHVYGNPGDKVLREDSPTRPFHPYAYTHRAAEDVVNYYSHYKNFRSIIFRGSNGYGCPMDLGVNQWMLMFNDFCRQAVTTQRIIINSSGKQHRNVIALEDMARAVEHFLFDPRYVWQNEIYNLAGERSISIYEIAERVARRYKRKYKKDLKDIVVKNEGGSTQKELPVRIDIEKLRRTGFRLKGNMDLEIDKTLEICKGFLRAGRF
jgi:UDP-glucose 4-epimerase